MYSLISYFLQSDTFFFIIHREEKDPNVKLCISMKDHETIITSDAGMEYQFNYDYSIWSFDPKDPNYVDQEKLYKLMGQPLLNSAFEGYNTCLFAYGQVCKCKLMCEGLACNFSPQYHHGDKFLKVMRTKTLLISKQIHCTSVTGSI